MNIVWPRFELPLVLGLCFAGAAFLLKMCYLSLAFNTLFGLIFLTIVYVYLRVRHGLKLPTPLLLLVFMALQVDALGNFFRLYGHPFGPMQYDEFSHLCIQILVTPQAIWLVKQGLEACGQTLSPFLSCFFASTIMFSLAAFYEIIELWDDLYFNGQRIWNIYDTATDLQWDFVGIVIGTMLWNLILRLRTVRLQPVPLKAC